MSYVNGPRVVTDGLVLYLDAGNAKSYPGTGTSWYDLSNNNRTGTLTNGPTFSSANGGSIVFDGTNDQVAVASSSYVYNGGTWEMWVKLNSNGRAQGFMGANDYGAGRYINFWMNTNNYMRWEVIGTTSSTYLSINSTTAFTTGVWYHVVGVFDTSNNIIYINGRKETSSSTGATNVPTTYSTALYVGVYGDASYPAAANIAIAKVYNRPLSPSEILQNYNATKGRFIS